VHAAATLRARALLQAQLLPVAKAKAKFLQPRALPIHLTVLLAGGRRCKIRARALLRAQVAVPLSPK
jgi:hypothetical protein